MKTNDVILQTTTKLIFFIIILFSIHIFFAGHYAPGGGVGRCFLTASGIVLVMRVYDIKTVSTALPINYTVMTAIGLLVALATAAGSIIFNVPFFTHAFDYFVLPLLSK